MSASQSAQTGFRAWIPVIGLAFAAFVFNTSEFLPVGLLPDMAASLNESVSFMGLVITGYAWVVSIMSLPLALLTARFERKKLLLFHHESARRTHGAGGQTSHRLGCRYGRHHRCNGSGRPARNQNGAPLRMGGILLCHRRSGLFSAYAPLVCPAAVSEQECRLA